MNKFKILSLVVLATVTIGQAQDLEQAKKAIDAEQYAKAKSILKGLVTSEPKEGKVPFLLGTIYLKENSQDSAKIYFAKGLEAKDNSNFNYIGLGQIDLDNKNLTAAQIKFSLATKDMRRKDTEEFVYIAKAYMNSDVPDFNLALANLNKAKEINSTDALIQLTLGDAYYGLKNQNEAYSAYRNGFTADNSLIRAKMQLGVLLKGAKAYTEAVKAFDDVIAIDSAYGPVYRELAETYYYWGNNDLKNYDEYIKKALGFYEKYMSMTDYSLDSRMRHADFLILAKDYAAVEVEADKMKLLDKVNPRIYRYLGYAAYENGNVDVAIKSLEDFTSNPANKVIARDFMYLGFSKLKKANNIETKTIDTLYFDSAIADIKKSVEMEITMTNELSEIGKKLYEQRLFKEAAAVYEIAVTNPESRNHLLDNFYLGNSIYFDNTKKGLVKPDPIALQKADTAFGKVIEASPTTQDAIIFRARTNNLMENDEMTIKYYEDYIKVVTDKGPEEVTKSRNKFIESYNNIGAIYANTDKVKAKEYFNKTIAIDPINPYATQSLAQLK